VGVDLPPRVVVIGGGTMGSGIAMAFAARGPAVDLVEPSASVREALPARLHEGLGRMHVRSGDLAGAGAAFEGALAQRPDDPDALAGYGDTLLAQGKAEQALPKLERALQLAPHVVATRTALARGWTLSSDCPTVSLRARRGRARRSSPRHALRGAPSCSGS
jgi:cytochrome c-type biogenesis protein CcmH/NrfG